MKPTKVFLKQTVLLSAIFNFLFSAFSRAQVKEIISEGAYNMGDGETPSIAEERAFQANAWFEKSYQFLLNNEYDKAMEALISAIALNPNFSLAYNRRGAAYIMKGHMAMRWRISIKQLH